MDIEQKLTELGICPRSEQPFHPPTKKEIAKLERKLHAELPDDYKSFVSRYGDSRFDKSVMVRPIQKPPRHISDTKTIIPASFLGKEADGDGLCTFYEIFEGRMPKTMFAFGLDLWGNAHCLCVSGKDRNKVYLWDFENEPDEDDYTDQGLPVPKDLWYQNLTLIANSFTDYIMRIEIVPGDE